MKHADAKRVHTRGYRRRKRKKGRVMISRVVLDFIEEEDRRETVHAREGVKSMYSRSFFEPKKERERWERTERGRQERHWRQTTGLLKDKIINARQQVFGFKLIQNQEPTREREKREENERKRREGGGVEEKK